MANVLIYGSKKQKGGAQKPHITPDDLVSTDYAKILYGLAEGEIVGLADGGKSIKLDGTPLINDNGQPNFTGVKWDFRTGTLDQSHIAGFPAIENESNVGVELRHDRPWVKAISNRELSAVRVRLNFNALREQKDNGDIVGYAIEYAIDVQTDGGSFIEILRQSVRGKSSQGYKKSHRIDLPKGNKWTIRVRRITPNRNSDLIADTVHIDALTEIIDAKLAYPCTALLGLSYDAKTFNNIAKLAVRLKGKIIQVPSNYNADTRQYNGLWDGSFKPAYSNNPAWVFYDLCNHKRYGLGERLAGMVDKWRLYQIGQYCDEPVDDGKGGQEPRFTVNVYIQKADDAYRVLQNLAGVFRGLSFWDGSNIVVDADTPKEPVYTFSPANVVGGEFAYTGTRARDRHTLEKVAWDNPENGFATEYELIPDEQAIAKYGVRTLDISAFGCTSQGQAQRAGLWALKAEQLETQTVSFKTGLMGFIPQVGQVINVADNVFAGRAISGKIVAVSADKRQITLDRMAGKVSDMLTVNGTDGVQSAKITAVRGQVATLDKPINAEPEHIWAVVSDDLKLKQFRILSIAQNDDATFDITALEYNAQKYAAVDSGAAVTLQPYTVLKATPITAPNTVTLTASTRTVQGQAVTTLTINWEQVAGATAYIVKWRKDDGNWQTLPKVSGQSVDIDGVYAGNYTAQVQAVDSFDNESLATTSQLTPIAGKTGKPPRPTALKVTGLLFGMGLDWSFAKGSDDTNYTEIQVSPDSRSNIATLGTFAYPTNKHTINGLQGNLTQYYRARIVDKLGNTSDWTAWTSGTTEAQADKVLNLLQGQITASQLHQDLSTPIGKIGGIESGLNTAKIDLSALNASMTAAKSDIDKARTDINTATSNINTERNRISAAIADISTLQSANNAKTQEIANLTQTINGHTSSIRDLAVTTGDLSQRYTQLKTVSDKATSDITAIQQTQAGQATQLNTIKATADKATADLRTVNQTLADETRARTTAIDSLSSRFDGLSVGGRNLILNSNQQLVARGAIIWQSRSFSVAQYDWLSVNSITISAHVKCSDVQRNGNPYHITVEIKAIMTNDSVWWINATLNAPIASYSGRISKTYSFTNLKIKNVEYANILINNVSSNNDIIISKPKLEIGTVATDWAPAPEDLQADIDSKASTANLETLRQTLTDADTALGQRISAMDTAYKQADSQTTAKLGQLEQSISDKDRAMAQRVDTLNANYTALDNRTKWIELTATTDLNTLTETGKYFIRAGNNPNAPFAQWAYMVVEKARNDRITQTAWADNNASLVYTRVYNGAWQVWEKTATGNELATKASTASLNEFKQAQATKDSATATKLSQLESGLGTKANATALNNYYTKAQTDQAIGGRVERFEASLKRQEIHAVTDLNTLTTQGQYFIKAAYNPNAPVNNWLFVDVETSNDEWIVVQTVRQDNNTKNQWVRQRYNGNWSAWEKVATGSELNDKANAAALNDLSTKVNQVDGKLTAEASKINTLQTTVNGQTASIQQHSQSINGLSAQYTVKIDNGGRVAGYGLASGAGGISDFAVVADKFYIAPPTGGKGIVPFVVRTTPTTIGGVSVPAGTYIDNACIQNGSIDIAKINKASIASLSALSANIGHFKSAETGARLEIKDGVLLVYDDNNVLRVRLGVW